VGALLSAVLIGGMIGATPAPAEAALMPTPADPLAGGHASALYRNLVGAAQLDGFLFGQQHANWDSKRYTVGDDGIRDWRGGQDPPGSVNGFLSDIELATMLTPGMETRSPSVFGFNLQTALNLKPETQRWYAERVVQAFATGSVVTVHFPADNPVSGGDHKDVSGNLLCMLSTDWNDPPAEAAGAVDAWKGVLSTGADFIELVNEIWRDPDDDGLTERTGRVAMVLRPYHEMLRIRHWWSAPYYYQVPGVCDRDAAAAFRSMWRQTVDHIVSVDDPSTVPVEGLDVHGLLFAWSPDRPTSTPAWEAFYPNNSLGDARRDYVDVIAFDVYEGDPDLFSRQLVADTAAVVRFNEARPPGQRDVVALGEVGRSNGLAGLADINWYTRHLLYPLVEAGLANRIAYAMTWANLDSDHYWVPLPCFNLPACNDIDEVGHAYGNDAGAGDSMSGFRAFVNSSATVFREDLPAWWRAPNGAPLPSQSRTWSVVFRAPCLTITPALAATSPSDLGWCTMFPVVGNTGRIPMR
jgi:hypothetical protein